jgi:hypothetical protein
MIGAVLLDSRFLAALEEMLGDPDHACADADLAALARDLALLGRRDGALPGLDGILDAFRSHPARDLIVPLIEDAAAAESPQAAFEGARARLEAQRFERHLAAKRAVLPTLAPADAVARDGELDLLLRGLRERAARAQGHANPTPASGEPARTTSH